MTGSCVVPNCSISKYSYDARNKQLTFHSFPVSAFRRKMRDSWITTIRQLNGDPDWEPLQSSTVCSRHFDPTMFVMTGSGGRRFIGYPDITLCLGKDDEMKKDEQQEAIIPVLNNVLEEGGIDCGDDDIDVKLEDPLLCNVLETFCVKNVCTIFNAMCELEFPQHFQQTARTTERDNKIAKQLFDSLIRLGQGKPLFEDDNPTHVLGNTNLDENQDEWHQFDNFIDESDLYSPHHKTFPHTELDYDMTNSNTTEISNNNNFDPLIIKNEEMPDFSPPPNTKLQKASPPPVVFNSEPPFTGSDVISQIVQGIYHAAKYNRKVKKLVSINKPKKKKRKIDYNEDGDSLSDE